MWRVKGKRVLVGFSKETLCWHGSDNMQGQGGAQNLTALVSLLVRSGYLEWPEWTFWNEPASAGTLSSSVLFVCVTRIRTSFTPTQASSCHVSTQRLFTRGKCYCGIDQWICKPDRTELNDWVLVPSWSKPSHLSVCSFLICCLRGSASYYTNSWCVASLQSGAMTS